MSRNLADSDISIVSVVGDNVSKCGYCGGRDTSHTFGIWAHYLTCEDYQQLIDRGWRRSGQYVYKPNLKQSCCQQYTIRCPISLIEFIRLDANHFAISKSQRKLVHKFNRYVLESQEVEKVESNNNKKQKSKSSQKSVPDTLLHLMSKPEHGQNMKSDDTPEHKFEIEMEPSSFTKEKFDLYCKYQIEIHHDPPSKLKEKSFRQFLVDSPLKPREFDSEQDAPCAGYGSFHQTYRLDGKLIAVAVLDVLPNCLSSVYFMYDPEYAFLSLGKYSALREIALTQTMEQKASKSIHWYYMGYYIHTCQKMRYKGQYKPSYLLDVESYMWEPYEQCAPLLEESKYVAFKKAIQQRSKNKDNGKSLDNTRPVPDFSPEVLDPTLESLQSILSIFSGMLVPVT
ncbi:hypothetical protein INT43_003344, partial [Umbelopsis isabellina]